MAHPLFAYDLAKAQIARYLAEADAYRAGRGVVAKAARRRPRSVRIGNVRITVTRDGAHV